MHNTALSERDTDTAPEIPSLLWSLVTQRILHSWAYTKVLNALWVYFRENPTPSRADFQAYIEVSLIPKIRLVPDKKDALIEWLLSLVHDANEGKQLGEAVVKEVHTIVDASVADVSEPWLASIQKTLAPYRDYALSQIQSLYNIAADPKKLTGKNVSWEELRAFRNTQKLLASFKHNPQIIAALIKGDQNAYRLFNHIVYGH